MIDEMSESDLSLADDESSFHPSDYSESSIEDSHIVKSGDKTQTNRSPIQTYRAEVVSRQHPAEGYTRKVPRINLSLSGSSSGGSPWVDDTGSSSSTSSIASMSQVILSVKEQKQFDEARARLKQTQKRPRLFQQSRVQTFDSSSSVCTGKHPMKPIDVTGANDVSMLPVVLEKKKNKGRRQEDSALSASTNTKEIFKIKNDPVTSCIVGVLPSIVEGREPKMHDTYRNSKSARRPVPPVVVPEFCSPTDDMSSLGVTFSCNKGKQSNHRQRFAHDDGNDLENGKSISRYENDSLNVVGWIEQRTNLELCLLFSVASSTVALIALLTLILAK